MRTLRAPQTHVPQSILSLAKYEVSSCYKCLNHIKFSFYFGCAARDYNVDFKWRPISSSYALTRAGHMTPIAYEHAHTLYPFIYILQKYISQAKARLSRACWRVSNHFQVLYIYIYLSLYLYRLCIEYITISLLYVYIQTKAKIYPFLYEINLFGTNLLKDERVSVINLF